MSQASTEEAVASDTPLVRIRSWTYGLGEYAAGVGTAVAAAVSIHALVDPGWDMVIPMLVGAVLGSAAHVVVLALLGPVVGMFHVMAPGALIGMYGGMLFAMRDSMQAVSWSQSVAVAVAVGVLAVAGVQLYDRALRSGAGSEPADRETSP
jgi:hypothetical protein